MELLPKSQSFTSSRRLVEPVEMPTLILVVEDEVLIRMMVAETLADEGFQISEAANGRSALEAIEAAGEELRCVILDVGLPDVSGEHLIDKIRALRPRMPIIVTTGYDTNELRRKLRDDALSRILTKPFLPEMLNTILREWGITA
jgi:DNA-binding response OmpR family regulator